MSDLTCELFAEIVAATTAKREATLRFMREDMPGPDAETLRRMSGLAEPFLTLKEVGRRLSLHPCTLFRWGIPGHGLGGRRRWRMSEVEAYLGSEDFKKRVAELKEKRAGRTKKRSQETGVRSQKAERHGEELAPAAERNARCGTGAKDRKEAHGQGQANEVLT